MVRRIINITLFFTLILSGGCYYDIESELYGEAPCIIPEDINYGESIEPIIAGKCATGSCHVAGGTGPGNLENTSELTEMIDNGTFQDRVIIRKDMPKAGPLSPCEIQTLQKWIDQGASVN